jgi:energy-converting hydrogenase B subunit D
LTVLQLAALLAVAFCGTVVVAVRDPLRQAMTSGVFGVALSLLFLVFGAPDVALSQIAVAGVAVPVMVLLTLARLRQEGDDE